METGTTRKKMRRLKNIESLALGVSFSVSVLSACYGDWALNVLGLEGMVIGSVLVDETTICVTLALLPFFWAAHLIMKEVKSRRS